MRIDIDRVGQWATIVMCLAVTGAIAHQYAGQYLNTGQSPAPPPPFLVGEPVPEALWPSVIDDRSVTAVLFLDSRCGFCTDSMPFYRQLSARRTTQSLGLSVVGPARREHEIRAYLAQHNLDSDRVGTIEDRGAIRIRGTPALLLLTHDRRVLGSWSGRLGGPREREVFATLDAAARGEAEHRSDKPTENVDRRQATRN